MLMSTLTIGFFVLLHTTSGNQGINLALNKQAKQSSTLASYTANKAVNGNFNRLDFSHTNQTGIRWWTVDLGKRYSIGQIKLFNRWDCCQERLADITTLTSTVDIPTDPSLSSPHWIARAYRGPAYAAVGIIDFKPAIQAQHVAVYSSLDPNTVINNQGQPSGALTLLEVEVYAPNNLALNKTVRQSGTLGSNSAEKANNGIYTDFSQTSSNGGNWWRVDLGEKYSIGTIELHGTTNTLEKISILTSNYESPPDPDLDSDEWTQRSYQGPPYGEVGVIQFTTPVEGRHVAVFSESSDQPLSLTEVVIYEYNYAKSEKTTQSSIQNQKASSFAVDGDLATLSRTTIESGPWWMVDLGRLIRLKSVEVFVRNGTCSSGTIECSDRLSGLYLLTSKVDTNTAPSTDSSSVWETCYQNNTAQGDSFKKKCSSNQTPLTRLFSILSTSGERVELREVDIFGHEAAQLTEKVAGRKESSTYTSVTISFVPWNQLMVGFDPPTKYEVKAKHDGNIITSPGDITHDSNSERTTTTLSGLDPGIEYEISVSCLLEGSIPCEGISPTFMVSTSACSGPSPPEFHYAVNSIMDSGRERWNYTYNWEVSASNCRGSATYTYSSSEVQVQSITDRSATFLIDGYKEFTFTVTSENEAGLSSSSDSKEISPKLKPQFGVSNNIRLSPTSECVDLAWDKPEFIGGPESSIEYQVTCGVDENWVTANGLSASSCGHKPSTNVTCKLKALNGNLQSDELTATTTTLEEDVTTPSPASQTIIIAASIASVVVLLLVVGVVILVMFRRRKSLANKKSSNAAVFTANGPVSIEQEAPPVKKPSIKPRAHNPSAADEVETVANESPYGNADSIQASQSEAIPIGKLAWYNKTNMSVIRQQYEVLEKLPKPNMSVALQPENKGKCRYKGLYPSNKHRVRLDPTYPGETDFINATYLQAYSVDDHFIAAQGPFTDAVVKDFWLMIWQQKPSAIVMVTKAVENSKVKCLQYYPLDVGAVKTFGEFRVTLRSSEIWSDFTTNSLMVQKGDESRVIPHFNYIAWPDHGVPDLEVFVSFHRLVKSHIYRNFTQPVLIHCSAGVGRTGTYVALDYLLDQAKMEGVVDMFECVREMRTRRPCMIQTVEQYEFLHHVLYQSLSTKKFSCNAGQLAQKIDIHTTQPGSETDVIHAEYQHILERIQDLSLTYKTARASANRKKNRYSEMLASDEHMPYLINGAQGNYVNATFVDGYREKKQWIATQLPLSHTVGDFWQLQTERQIHIVVQLEMTQTPFYPGIDGTDMVAGSILIKRNSSTDSEHVMTLSLEVESKEAKEAVYVIVLKNWEANSLPPSRKIIALHMAVEKLQQQTCSRKVTVTCLDASTRCGLYICAHNAIEKLKVEQDVDIYYPTVMAKLRRPQFVSLPEHYSHIYSIVQDYINEFSEYSNFK